MIKNLILVYIRLVVTLILSLVTSSFIFRNLGEQNYGIYNVVGGVVVVLAFINSAMVATTQRFLSFNLNDRSKLIEIFRISKTIHYLIAAFIFLFGESIGLYFLNNYLNFPETKRVAVNIVFQCSVISAVVMTLNIPYLSMILVHRKVGFYSLIGVLDGFLKLFLALSLTYVLSDKLVIYSISMLAITSIMYLSYFLYSIYKFNFIYKTKLIFSISQMREMIIFSGWNLVGVIAGLGQNVGVNILLNIYFDPRINASRALSTQIHGALNNLNLSSQTIYAPIIISKFAEHDKKLDDNIILFSRINFLIMLLVLVPIYYYLYQLIEIWLKSVPFNLIKYIKILMMDLLVISFTGPLHTLIQATGDIKFYQLTVSSLLLLNIPLGVLFFSNNFASESIFYISLILNFLALILRIIISNYKNLFEAKLYLRKVIVPCCIAFTLAVSLYFSFIPEYFKVLLTELLLLLFLAHTLISNDSTIDIIRSLKRRMLN